MLQHFKKALMYGIVRRVHLLSRASEHARAAAPPGQLTAQLNNPLLTRTSHVFTLNAVEVVLLSVKLTVRPILRIVILGGLVLVIVLVIIIIL